MEMLIAGRNPPIEARRSRETNNIQVAQKLARGEGTARPLNPDWDRAFMQHMVSADLAGTDYFSDADITRLAGVGGHEVRTWIAAFFALAALGPYVYRRAMMNGSARNRGCFPVHVRGLGSFW